jgi:hypothetical protein
LVAVAAVFAMLAGDADARQRGSVGSRGSKTYSAPAPTATAPNCGRTDQPLDDAAGHAGAASTARASAGRAAGRHVRRHRAASSAALRSASSAPACSAC